MKIIDEDDLKMTIELEDPSALTAFKMGLEDGRRHWSRHPETDEMARAIAGNLKQAQIVVKYGDSYVRIR